MGKEKLLAVFMVAVLVAGAAVGIVFALNNGNYSPFRPVSDNAEIILNSDTGIKTIGGGTYNIGDTVEIEATTDEDTTFIKWIDSDGKTVSYTTDFSIEILSAGRAEFYAEGNTSLEWEKGQPTKLYSESDWSSAVWTIYKPRDSNGYIKIGTTTNGWYTFNDPGQYRIEISADRTDGSTVERTSEISIGNTIFKHSWKTDGNIFSVYLSISEGDYVVAKNKVAPEDRCLKINEKTGETTALGFLTPDDKYIKSIAEQISGQISKYKITDKETVGNIVLDFVQQSITYADDKKEHGRNEYWAFPLETLYTAKGDCEDTTFLFSSIMKKMGYETFVCLVNYMDNSGHAFSMIDLDSCSLLKCHKYTLLDKTRTSDGRTYYVCETTPDEMYFKFEIGVEILDSQKIKITRCFRTDLPSNTSYMYSIYPW